MLSTIDHIILDEEAALLKQSPRGSFNDKNNMTMMCNGGGDPCDISIRPVVGIEDDT